jgi:hypothetical protein
MCGPPPRRSTAFTGTIDAAQAPSTLPLSATHAAARCPGARPRPGLSTGMTRGRGPIARGVATGAPGGAAAAWPPVFTAQHTRAPTPVHDPASPAITPSLSAVPLAPPPPSTPAVALAAARRAQPVACDPQVWRTIGQAGPGLRWRTRSGSGGAPCRGPLHSPPLPERQPLAPDKAPLLAGWNRGGRHGSQRLRASRRRGFRGPYGMVARAVRRRRRAPGFAPIDGRRLVGSSPPVAPARLRVVAPKVP